jgi:hypothetical protein
MAKRMFIVDNFYSNPDQVREFALSVDYEKDLRWYKGLRSHKHIVMMRLRQRLKRSLANQYKIGNKDTMVSFRS